MKVCEKMLIGIEENKIIVDEMILVIMEFIKVVMENLNEMVNIECIL